MSRRVEFDRKFQRRLVRAIFQAKGEGKEVLDCVNARDFDTVPTRWAINKMKWVWEKTRVPPTIDVLEHEAIRDATLGLIQERYIDAYESLLGALRQPVANRAYYLDQAYSYTRYSALTDFMIASVDDLHSKEGPDWDSIEAGLRKQLLYSERSDGDMGQDFFADTNARIERRKLIETLGVATGINVIDEKMRQRGLPPCQLGVMIAPPGRGKTAVLCYMSGSAVLYGYKVLFISCELSEDAIAERHEARLSGIRLKKLDSRSRTLRTRIKAVKAKHPTAGLKIKFYPTGTLTIKKLEGLLRRLEAEAYYPDVIFIDYVDNMNLDSFRSGGGGDSDYSPLGRLYVAIRGIAGERNIPIWTASQSNRMSLDKEEIGIKDLADSFKKAAVADVMVAIAQTPEEKTRKVARLCMAKNRNGIAGSIDAVVFDTSRVMVSELI